MFLDDDFNPDMRPNTTAIRRAAKPQAAMRSTSGAHGSPIPQRRTSGQPYSPPAAPAPRISTLYAPRKTGAPAGPKLRSPFQGNTKVHWLLPVGIGMILMLILWETGTAVLAWGTARYDDIRYGNPRTFQMDAVVGHGADSQEHPSHFMALNLNRQAIVVEFPAGNPQGAQSYVVPYYILGQNASLTPITLEFRNVDGHADGKPDMIVHIHLLTQDQTFVFVNTGSKFRPPSAQDHIHL
jgi:hypothetical protein